ncbi:TonB-dependent siderophore receptor [Xanthomonas maliensis]|uniref:TonB-dependent receptor n=1 Tax=Xanthomonas maliensis TaxID=1321368 RepID=UPI0004CF2263
MQDTSSTGSALGLRLIDTPASISVRTRAQLDAAGDANLNDAISRSGAISAMAHPGNSLSALSTRGFTDSTSVMRLYDGLRQYGGIGVTFPFDTFSIERIEVLRGPASVIDGDGAIGGVVNVVPKKPHFGAIENLLSATLGSQETARWGIDSGGALAPTLAYRATVSGNRSAGWVDRGEQRDATVSAALLWQASPDLQLTLSHADGDQHPMRYFGTPLIDGQQLAAVRHRNYNVADSLMHFRDRWSQMEALWTPTDALEWRTRLYRIDSRRQWRNAEGYLYDPASGLIDRSDNTQILHQQEQTGMTSTLRVRHAIGAASNTMALGVDANRADFRHTNNTYTGSSGPVDPFDPIPGLFVSAAPTLPRYRNHASQAAAFLEDRLALSARWSVLAGVRHDRATLERTDLISGQEAFSRVYSTTGWRVGTVFAVQPSQSFYAQYSAAADPIGGLLMLSPANANFDLARGRQLEIGWKQAFARGEWTLAAYRIRKTGLLSRDPADPDRSVQIGAQTSRGVEAALTYALSDAWSLDLTASALHAAFANFLDSSGAAGVVVSRDGNVPPNVAERLATAWLSWQLHPDWRLAGGVRYVGKRYADNANTLVLPGYATTDVALSWQARPATRLSARIFNLFDRTYYTTAYYTDTQWFVGPDRRIELTLEQRF